MAVDTALVPAPSPDDAALAAEVVVKGDLAKLNELQRMQYIGAVCRSLGLNPLTRPFELLTLNGKLVLYATKGCTDQLRTLRGVTVTSIEPREVGDLYVVVATGRDRDGREDAATGAVAIKGLAGESLANAMMKAETKAKRRLTLSLAGLGFADESEIDSIPRDAAATESEPKLTLAERAAARAAAVAESVDEPNAAEIRPEGAPTPPAAADVPAEPARAAAPQPGPAERAYCLVASPYGDGAACGLAVGHAGFHKSQDLEGAITGSWE